MPTWERLADGFPPAREADWQGLVRRGVEGIGALRAHSMDGIPVGPVYAPVPGMRVSRQTTQPWTIVRRVTVTDRDTSPRGAADAGDACNSNVEFLFVPNSASQRLTGRMAEERAGERIDIITDVTGLARPVWIDAGFGTPGLIESIADSVVVHAICDPLALAAREGSIEDGANCYAAIAALDADA
jgi:hypothetical protein